MVQLTTETMMSVDSPHQLQTCRLIPFRPSVTRRFMPTPNQLWVTQPNQVSRLVDKQPTTSQRWHSASRRPRSPRRPVPSRQSTRWNWHKTSRQFMVLTLRPNSQTSSRQRSSLRSTARSFAPSTQPQSSVAALAPSRPKASSTSMSTPTVVGRLRSTRV